MGWSIGFCDRWKRDIGYGVPAKCDHPDCDEDIDRGLSYLCGGTTALHGDLGCGLHFCEKHRPVYRRGEHLCARCGKYRPPFKPKPDVPEWLNHKLTDESWEQWRQERPEEAAECRRLVAAAAPIGDASHG